MGLETSSRKTKVNGVTEEALALARVIWDYLQIPQEPQAADVLVTLGTNDLRVAEFAAELYHAGYAPLLVFTGGIAHQGDLLETSWTRSEAEMFAEVAESRGVPRGRILLEPCARNTAENIRFTRRLLEEREIGARNLLIAVKPFMQRRTHAHLGVEWPEMPARIVAERMEFLEYFTEELTPERIINIMLGDLQRLWIYGRRGWSVQHESPEEVHEAFRKLVEMGFDKHLVRE